MNGPHGVNNPQWYARFKRWVISPKACLEGNSEPLAEKDSWALDRAFNIWSVPPTTMHTVTSNDFVGKSEKECSLQMFVKGCTTLGEYVDVSPSMHGLPRPFLRWHCGSEQQTGFFSTLNPQTNTRAELLSKLPKESLSRVALHNFAIEDIDCHFENILVKAVPLTNEDSVFSRVFRGDATVSDEEIAHCVENLFQHEGNQTLLDQLLFSEIVTDEGEQKKVTLIKHDGGSSNPHNHSSAWDYLSIRFKYLFEVLPHFEETYSDEVKQVFIGKEDVLNQFLYGKAERELRDILKATREIEGETKLVSEIFFAKEENETLLREFIFTKKITLASQLLNLIAALVEASGASLEASPTFQFYFNYHLKRIHGNIQTRLNSYQALKNHLNNEGESMRTLFKEVRSYDDFEREGIVGN